VGKSLLKIKKIKVVLFLTFNMDFLKEEKGAVARAAMLSFATLVVIAIVWNIMGPVLNEQIFAFAENRVADDMKTTYKLIDMVWRWWPIILLGANIIYLFVQSQEPHRVPR